MKGWIGITLGDPSGIGPEVTLKALAKTSADNFRYLLLGNESVVRRLNSALGVNLPIQPFESYAASASGRFFIWNTGPELPENLQSGSSIAAESAMSALTEGTQRSTRGELDGIV